MKRPSGRSGNPITPLHEILQWWRSIDAFYQDHIAANICLRLLPKFDRNRYNEAFAAYLIEEMPAERHVARCLAVRAIVSFWFFSHKQRQSSEMLLDAVETADAELKSLANDALGRSQHLAKAEKDALKSWQQLCKGPISDSELLRAERLAMLRR